MVLELIPVHTLKQFVYCNRLGYLEWVQKEFETSDDVAQGEFAHRNADKETIKDVVHSRSVMLSDENLGMVAKIDILETDGNAVVPIEYKKSLMPDIPGNVYDSTMVQVCAQGLLLRANGYECNYGMVYYVGSKRRVQVPLDDVAVAKTLQALYDMKKMAEDNKIPPPLVDSPKCPRCSLVGICLPDETRMMNGSMSVDSVRRLYPIRNDAVPVYVQEQGAYVSVSGDTIVVKSTNGQKRKIRIIDVSDLTIYGNVQVTTQAVRRLCEENIPVCYLSYGGRFVGITSGRTSRNIDLRVHQHRVYNDKEASLNIARSIVYGKIRNSMTILRRNHKSSPEDTLKEMERMAKACKTVKKYDMLLGIEGMAAKLYFSEFSGMIKKETEFDFRERNRRPPKDPTNAILSYVYMMLVKQAEITIRVVGLDPYLGYLHTPHHGRPSLALDLIEEFRPTIGDSVCIGLINNGVVKTSDFVVSKFGVAMTDACRRKVISAFETRMDTSIQHKILGYTASYRRIMETQTRLLARHITGEIPEYPPFRVR